jgi:hypothetical protein
MVTRNKNPAIGFTEIGFLQCGLDVPYQPLWIWRTFGRPPPLLPIAGHCNDQCYLGLQP